MLTFVHISDTHIRAENDRFHGVDPLRHLRAFVARINTFPQPPDFVLHTGDIADDKSADAYDQAQAILSDLTVPLWVVNGNHDDRALLRKYLGAPAGDDGDPSEPLVYAFEIKGERFLVLDAYLGLVRDPLGKLSDQQLARVRAEAASGDQPLTVLLHYPPFVMGSPWLDDNMIVTNGLDLHAALLPARDRLRGVFFGHLHRSCQIIRDGILYACAPSLSSGYQWRPWDVLPVIDADFPPGYNVVHYMADQVIVHQYTFPHPQ